MGGFPSWSEYDARPNMDGRSCRPDRAAPQPRLPRQTVQRCVQRTLAYGPLAALDNRARPGKEPTITPEAEAWLVPLACDKAKDHGIRMSLDDAMRARTLPQ